MKKVMKRWKQVRMWSLSLAIATGLLSGCSSGSSAGKQATTAEIAAAGEAAAAMQDTGVENLMGEEGASLANRYQESYDGDYLNSEEYHTIVEEGYQNVSENPLSTFSVDVDTASYGNIRRMINRGQQIPEDAVRIEEMINYFHYDYADPEGEEPFSVNTELSVCPWNTEHELLLIGIKAPEIDFENRPMSNLVFLLDVSGSMYDEDKLPLVQKSFSLLTDELTENDRVSIVTYAGYEQVVLDSARGDEKDRIRSALESLTAGGSTAGEAGIELAYEMAEKNYIDGGNNLIILATDGDLNVGVSSESGLKKLVEEKRKGGVHLSVLGVGSGNLKDNKMEALADNGDGNYNYIDSLQEAKKVLVEEMGGTLYTVAKDVKLQVEFNPVQVKGYRLIGYENRRLEDEDFDNDAVDAGEIGAGHRVTALYELIPVNKIPAERSVRLKYQETETLPDETKQTDGEILTVNIRYKAPDGDESELMSVPVKADTFRQEMPDNLSFASAVAEFGMVLRNSEYKGDASYEEIMELLNNIPDQRMDDYKDEFKQLVLQMMER